MVFVVDDNAFTLKVIRHTLEGAGHAVEAFSSAEDAIARALTIEPEIIISDIMMPGMDGHAFHQRYREEFPERETTFIFLSAISDPEDVARSLESGADDYLVKPLDARVLAAKVNALLRRQRRLTGIFHGTLQSLSGMQVLRACERQRLTGEVVFTSGEGEVLVVAFEAGELCVGDELDAVLDQVNRLDEAARFVVRARQPDFQELQGARSAVAAPPQALGRISTLELGTRVFSLQTEVSSGPGGRITTTVFLDGRVVKSRVEPAPADPGELVARVEAQHAEVERGIREKVEALVQARAEQPTSDEETRVGLIELGYQRWREKDFAGALEALEEAHRLGPDDRILSANLNLLRRRVSPP